MSYDNVHFWHFSAIGSLSRIVWFNFWSRTRSANRAARFSARYALAAAGRGLQLADVSVRGGSQLPGRPNDDPRRTLESLSNFD